MQLRIDAGVAGNEENFHRGIRREQLRSHGWTGEFAEIDIADEEVWRLEELARAGKGLATVGAGVNFVAAILQGERHEFADGFFIIYQKNDGALSWGRDSETTLLLLTKAGRTASIALVGFG